MAFVTSRSRTDSHNLSPTILGVFSSDPYLGSSAISTALAAAHSERPIPCSHRTRTPSRQLSRTASVAAVRITVPRIPESTGVSAPRRWRPPRRGLPAVTVARVMRPPPPPGDPSTALARHLCGPRRLSIRSSLVRCTPDPLGWASPSTLSLPSIGTGEPHSLGRHRGSVPLHEELRQHARPQDQCRLSTRSYSRNGSIRRTLGRPDRSSAKDADSCRDCRAGSRPVSDGLEDSTRP